MRQALQRLAIATNTVPYTGATANVNLGNFSLLAAGITSTNLTTNNLTVNTTAQFNGSFTVNSVTMTEPVSNIPQTFTKASEDVINFSFLPPQAVTSATVNILQHAPTTGNVQWELSYLAVNVGEDVTATRTTITETTSLTANSLTQTSFTLPIETFNKNLILISLTRRSLNPLDTNTSDISLESISVEWSGNYEVT